MIMEWIKCSDRMPRYHCILMTKTENGGVQKCYYHQDQMAWLSPYSKEKRSYFQDCNTMKWLHDVTHWKPSPPKE
jgi:hypothetical protein